MYSEKKTCKRAERKNLRTFLFNLLKIIFKVSYFPLKMFQSHKTQFIRISNNQHYEKTDSVKVENPIFKPVD